MRVYELDYGEIRDSDIESIITGLESETEDSQQVKPDSDLFKLFEEALNDSLEDDSVREYDSGQDSAYVIPAENSLYLVGDREIIAGTAPVAEYSDSWQLEIEP